MFRFFRKRCAPRVFLGALAVAPRTDFKRFLEEGGKEVVDLHLKLQRALAEIFVLPPAGELTAPQPTDVALDVFVTRFQAGGGLGEVMELGGYVLPVVWLWIPKIELSARLYRVVTHQTIAAFRVRQRIGWRELVRRFFSGRGFVFEWQDLEGLLYRASDRLLAKVRREIGV